MEVTMHKMDGTTSGKLDLPAALFDVQVKPDVVHEAVVAQRANYRTRFAHTKDRSEVRGGGRKPWKQKGTGRARHGSRRSPIWIGGGVTFGPLAEKRFFKKINKKVKRQALRMMLTDKLRSERLVLVDQYTDDGKSKTVTAMRAALPGTDASALIVTTTQDKAFIRAARNVPNTATIGAKSLNVRDLAKYTYLIVSKEALEQIKETYLA